MRSLFQEFTRIRQVSVSGKSAYIMDTKRSFTNEQASDKRKLHNPT